MQRLNISLTIGYLLLALTSFAVSTSAQAAAMVDFSGGWTTTWGNGASVTNMALNQYGDQVSGEYAYRGGKISGIVRGNVLSGTWVQSDGAKGHFQFAMSPDGNSFRGRWRNGFQGPWSRDAWNGTRY